MWPKCNHTYGILHSLLHICMPSECPTKPVAVVVAYLGAAFPFLVSLVTFDTILSCTKGLSDHLQSTEIDLAGAAS